MASGKGLPVLLTAIIGSTLASPSTSSANVFSATGVEPRSFVDQQDRLWRMLLPVGTIASDFSLSSNKGFGGVAPGWGTAFLVSPCYAMTSYHVPFGRTEAPDPTAYYPVTVRFGLSLGREARLTVRGSVRFWEGASNDMLDVAIIRLAGCPGLTLGWYDLARPNEKRMLPAAALTMPSFSRDRSMRQMSVQQGCGVRAYLPQQGWLLHDCATREGASGAPLIVQLSGVPLVVGVNAGELQPVSGIRRQYDARHANWAVALAGISETSPGYGAIRRDLARARLVNPLSTSSSESDVKRP